MSMRANHLHINLNTSEMFCTLTDLFISLFSVRLLISLLLLHMPQGCSGLLKRWNSNQHALGLMWSDGDSIANKYQNVHV